MNKWYRILKKYRLFLSISRAHFANFASFYTFRVIEYRISKKKKKNIPRIIEIVFRNWRTYVECWRGKNWHRYKKKKTKLKWNRTDESLWKFFPLVYIATNIKEFYRFGMDISSWNKRQQLCDEWSIAC